MSMGYVAADQDAFKAIADEGRRRILDAMLDKEQTIASLTRLLGLSQASVSQHVKVLRLAGLVDDQKHGRNIYYTVRASQLKVITDWAAKYERFWSMKLDGLEAHLAKKVN
jgi:DNA-binding transcriptional ArsR family regulator